LWLYLLEEDVRRVFRRPRCWRAVQAVADALLRDDTVSEDAAWELLTAALGDWGELLERDPAKRRGKG
jgi:hypothetical protein